MEHLTRAISVVVPVYNSAGTLGVARASGSTRSSRRSRHYELVLVNDGSADGSWERIERARRRDDPRVRGIDLMRNYGQHNALLAGIRAARRRSS